MAHLHKLASYAHGVLTERWGTEAVAPVNMTGGLLSLGLPIPQGWPAEAQADCAKLIGIALRDTYQMQIIPFTVAMHGRLTHVARISAQVYLSEEDVDHLAENVLAVARSCAGSAAAAQSLP